MPDPLSAGQEPPAYASDDPRDLRLLVDQVVDYAIFMVDPTGRVVSWNAGAERIKGYAAEEIIGRHFSAFYLPEDRAAGRPDRELEIAVAQGRVEDEGWRVRKDGTRFWANSVITALFDEDGTLRGFGEVVRDATERRMAEQALRESEERFRLLVHGVLDYAIFMLDPTGRVVSWNAGAERIKGYAADEIIGRHFSVFYPPEDKAAGKPNRELRTAAAEGRLEDEGWRVRKDGTRFWANVVITALFDEDGTLRGFGKVTRDMTERRTVERALDERGRLVAHLVRAQELERRRIAWDVHDDTIQSMVAVGMRLQLLASRLPAEHAAPVTRLDEAVAAAIARLRDLTFRLRPPGIDQNGLVEGLTSYLDEIIPGTGLAYTLQHHLDREPPRETGITVFRICQEALANVQKHAQAQTVAVSLTSVDHGVLVRVSDDGIGIGEAADGVTRPGHFGLIEMRERAETAGGWWGVRRRPGGGTSVEFWLPALRYGEEDPLP
ncbi:PAS domain-containing sensor histidine kinase [Microbispora sp. ATCC PTA-5024]|uniref:PAS domain-containing sensor histidine kinase n=1 Tax=Microbispora sp. ATCC PTA-5024 TaxID=316330 RepID=UPI0003DCF5E3|nr:PAS domain S-box protein [Microbispora sp. ATCC PTA-5024]ETK37046.1 histidine kinase [Microbispora sp. ATCC PTA-5024]